MASRRQSPTPKRHTALKRADGEPLNRVDIQYDVLHAIFSDTNRAFTNPFASTTDGDDAKLTFHDLYIQTIFNSPKATKVLKDKMVEAPEFAEDFAMLALLVNVGRINTTMSFFPEMRTAIRTYHPIPSLQRTSGNLQDAPRIKHILKMGLLEEETSSPPQTPDEVLGRAVRTHSCDQRSELDVRVVNPLLGKFIPSKHASSAQKLMEPPQQTIGTHFSQRFEFLDVFLKNEFSSASRARAFLWMCFNYLENPGSSPDDYDEEPKENPFADPHSKDAAPLLISLTPDEILQENVDSEEEKALTDKLVASRDQAVKKQATKNEKVATKAEEDGSAVAEPSAEPIVVSGDESPAKSKAPAKKRGGRAAGATASAASTAGSTVKPDKPKRAPRKTAGEKGVSRKNKLKAEGKVATASTPGSSHADDNLSMDADEDFLDAVSHANIRNGHVDVAEEASASFRIVTDQPSEPKANGSRHQRRYSPYPRLSEDVPRPARAPPQPSLPKRSMLQYEWDKFKNTPDDPFFDSDTEPGDESDHYEYSRRLAVVAQLQRPWCDPPHSLQYSVAPEFIN
ncbi:hypothetical protein BKA70DRAFT_1486744 [Coprinopsis sp. MPI-PUGE-AT-0042]|nr:hypothetical protein BKA70DRAFT_1486744 [Coprinopsis sp. MPI-PUGE-AT-0042]